MRETPPEAVMVEWFGSGGWTPVSDLIRALEADPHAYDERPMARPDDDRQLLDAAGVTVSEVRIPGSTAPARLYRPRRETVDAALVWVHGGGFIFYSLDGPEAHHISAVLAAGDVTVLSVDYRKAIGGVHYPAPSDDVLAAWLWAVDHLAELGIDSIDRLHLGGASAGGNLAAGVAKRLRDGGGPAPASVALTYPFIGPNPVHHDDPPAEVFPDWWLDQLARNWVGEDGSLDDPYAFPLNGDLSDLPPTLLVLSDIDTIRPSGEAYARKLTEHGTPATAVVEPGTTHGQLDRPGTPGAEETIATIRTWLVKSEPLP